MKQNTILWASFGLVFLSIVIVYIFKVQWNSLLPYAIFLLCPILHVFMMKDMNRVKNHDRIKKLRKNTTKIA